MRTISINHQLFSYEKVIIKQKPKENVHMFNALDFLAELTQHIPPKGGSWYDDTVCIRHEAGGLVCVSQAAWASNERSE